MPLKCRPTASMIHALLVAAFAFALLAAPADAQPDPAASYPNKPVRLIVGFAAGGGTDAMARIFAPKLSEILGQPVIIENRTGAGGRIGVDFVQSQPADGYTLAFGADRPARDLRRDLSQPVVPSDPDAHSGHDDLVLSDDACGLAQ